MEGLRSPGAILFTFGFGNGKLNDWRTKTLSFTLGKRSVKDQEKPCHRGSRLGVGF